MEDDADDLILEDEVDYVIPGALAGNYWLSGDHRVRTRQDLLFVEGYWTFSRHGWAHEREIAEDVTIVPVFDVETTGLKAEEGDRVIEVAAVRVGIKSDGTVLIEEQGQRSFVNPHCPIPPQASGVHHIIDKDVEGAPDLDEAREFHHSEAAIRMVDKRENLKRAHEGKVRSKDRQLKLK